MEYILIPITALAASFLTFYSGFGLGTILLPVFALYYPLELAIALTASVHLLNNLFKLGLVSKNINWYVLFQFGVPSAAAAFVGAYLLKQISKENLSVLQYNIGSHVFSVTWSGLIIGFLIILFAFVELSKKLSEKTFDKKYFLVGGFLSGFFGGLTGHQGALRSAFLLRMELAKPAFIATGVMIACLVDLVRLSIYTNFEVLEHGQINYYLLALAVLSAWLGAFAGNKLFTKTSLQFFKWFVGVFMLAMGVLIGVGIVG